MGKWRGVLLLLVLAAAGGSAQAEDYGVIDIGRHRHPQFIYDEPRRGRPDAQGEPVYLHVPRDHTKQWSRFCRLYRACARPAFFVSEEWYYGIFLGRAQAEAEAAETAEPPPRH